MSNPQTPVSAQKNASSRYDNSRTPITDEMDAHLASDPENMTCVELAADRECKQQQSLLLMRLDRKACPPNFSRITSSVQDSNHCLQDKRANDDETIKSRR
eukprot:Awhi_evm1s12365